MKTMTPNRGQEKWIFGLWAGIFLALFILNRYERAGDSDKVWEGWVDWEDPPVEARPSKALSQAWNKQNWPLRSNAQASTREQEWVRSDTVSASWLAKHWPEWKVAKYILVRARWGGVDSMILHREGLADGRWFWEFVPPSTKELTQIALEDWYGHPLWRAKQVRAVHHYQSRIRPLRSWEEVFALAPFDSIQQIWIPQYFHLATGSDK